MLHRVLYPKVHVNGIEKKKSDDAGMTGVPSPNTDIAVRREIGSGSEEGVSEMGGLVGICHWTVGGTDDWGAKFWMASIRETLRATFACATIAA